MGVNISYASPDLFCSEDICIALGSDDHEGEGQGGWILGKSNVPYADPRVDFPIPSDEYIKLLVKREGEHVARADFAARLMSGELDGSVRRDAIDWIYKVHSYYSFGPLSAYLAVNYLDRFLSKYKLPEEQEEKAWMEQLLSVACLSLAAKMEEIAVPLVRYLEIGEAKYVFNARTIRRMEIMVLDTLEWRMQAVTPFSYIDYFLHKMGDGSSPTKPLILRSIELILSTIKGIRFIEFWPSEIAAAVAIFALWETQIVVDIEKAATLCIHVNNERVLRCYEVIQRGGSEEEQASYKS